MVTCGLESLDESDSGCISRVPLLPSHFLFLFSRSSLLHNNKWTSVVPAPTAISWEFFLAGSFFFTVNDGNFLLKLWPECNSTSMPCSNEPKTTSLVGVKKFRRQYSRWRWWRSRSVWGGGREKKITKFEKLLLLVFILDCYQSSLGFALQRDNFI